MRVRIPRPRLSALQRAALEQVSRESFSRLLEAPRVTVDTLVTRGLLKRIGSEGHRRYVLTKLGRRAVR